MQGSWVRYLALLGALGALGLVTGKPGFYGFLGFLGFLAYRGAIGGDACDPRVAACEAGRCVARADGGAAPAKEEEGEFALGDDAGVDGFGGEE